MGILGDAYDTVAGAADHAAGSVDEAVGRTFDSKPGGGVVDGAVETGEAVYSATAGAADFAAGSTDEAVGRTFDDKPGGGVVDGTEDAVLDILFERPEGTHDSFDLPLGSLNEALAGKSDDSPNNTASNEDALAGVASRALFGVPVWALAVGAFAVWFTSASGALQGVLSR
jgi:hypothetical protein